MIKFKIQGVEYSIPTRWEEVTVKQFLQLIYCGQHDMVKFLSIVTDVPYDIMHRCKQVDVDEKLMPYINFFQEKFDFNTLELPYSIKVADKSYKIPRDLGFHSLGQKIEATNAMAREYEEKKDLVGCMVEVVAMYLQPIVQGGDYETEKAVEFQKTIEQLNIVDVYPIATFFFKKLTDSMSVKKKTLKQNTLKNKFKQAWKDLRNSKSLIQSTRLQTVKYGFGKK